MFAVEYAWLDFGIEKSQIVIFANKTSYMAICITLILSYKGKKMDKKVIFTNIIIKTQLSRRVIGRLNNNNGKGWSNCDVTRKKW